MPGGSNPTTRPANKPEREALKRRRARTQLRNELLAEDRRRRNDKSISDEDYRADSSDIYDLVMDINSSPGAERDKATLKKGKIKQQVRRDNQYRSRNSTGGGITAGYKYGGKVKKGYNYGGCVMAGRGGSFKGSN